VGAHLSSAPELGLPTGVLEGTEELVAIPPELGNLVGDLAGHLVDGHEERHLSLAEGVQDFALTSHDLEALFPVGDDADLGQMIVEPSLLVTVLPGSPHALKGHPTVQK